MWPTKVCKEMSNVLPVEKLAHVCFIKSSAVHHLTFDFSLTVMLLTLYIIMLSVVLL